MQIYFDQSEEAEAFGREYAEDMEHALGILSGKEGLDRDRVSVSVSFVGPDEIRDLNREYRDVDSVTDVLSFPQFEDLTELREMGELTGEEELGDVVICMDRAKEQAEEYGHPLRREVIYLFVHSLLHLTGYDHMEEEDKRVMRAREDEIMEELGIGRG